MWRTWLAVPTTTVYRRRRHCLNCPSFSPIIKRVASGWWCTSLDGRESPSIVDHRRFPPFFFYLSIYLSIYPSTQQPDSPSSPCWLNPESQVALLFHLDERKDELHRPRKRAISMLIRPVDWNGRLLYFFFSSLSLFYFFFVLLSILLWKIAGHSQPSGNVLKKRTGRRKKANKLSERCRLWSSSTSRDIQVFCHRRSTVNKFRYRNSPSRFLSSSLIWIASFSWFFDGWIQHLWWSLSICVVCLVLFSLITVLPFLTIRRWWPSFFNFISNFVFFVVFLF